MGYSASYDIGSSTASRAAQKRAGVDPFLHTTAAASDPSKRKTHDNLNPKGVTRESRDSDVHPTSRAFMVFLDVTGSMGQIARIIYDKLPGLMGLVARHRYLGDHPQCLFGAVGDYYSDISPLQVGQFETGNEMDSDLANIFLEGGGGGQKRESYGLALYWATRHTSIDCWEKRGEKPYLWLIGDEMSHNVTRQEILEVLGDTVEADIPIAEVVKRAQERFNVYMVIPHGTQWNADAEVLEFWQGLLGENAITLDDPSTIAEVIGLTMGLAEGVMDIDDAPDHLADAGLNPTAARSLSTSLAAVKQNASGAAIARGGALPGLDTPGSGMQRL